MKSKSLAYQRFFVVGTTVNDTPHRKKLSGNLVDTIITDWNNQSTPHLITRWGLLYLLNRIVAGFFVLVLLLPMGMDAPLYTRMLDMTDYALALNPENRLMGMLWHQGEHDAFEGNPSARYKRQVLEMIDSVRKRYGSPNLPFICGGFCYEWVQQYLKNATKIMQALREIADERDGVYIETDDLLSNHQKTGKKGIGDDVHFCRESLRVLGHRYFTAYQKITQKKTEE